MNLLAEFKAFAMRGNVIDLAVGVVIGGAFGKIVSSMVGDIIMPTLGVLTSGVDLTKLSVTLVSAHDAKPAVLLGYGKLIETTLDFVIIAFVIFLLLRVINRLTAKPEPPPAPPEPSAEEKLLTEIRDLLRSQSA